MKKTNYKTIKLEKGEINVFDFNGIKLHAYNTNDPLSDEVFVVEKGGNAVVIESPCFYDNIRELENYIKSLNVEVTGVLVSYHAAGATFLDGTKKYSTKHADACGHNGGGRALIDNFTSAFGEIFDSSIHTITDFIENGKLVLGGIEFDIIDTDEGFDIIMPEINAIYTHMLGHDCHSIVAGEGHAEALIGTLNGYLKQGYDLVLTSHYTPEDLKDVKTKLAYLKELTAIAKDCSNAAEFKQKVDKKYPEYSGQNYLDMTANFFFPKK